MSSKEPHDISLCVSPLSYVLALEIRANILCGYFYLLCVPYFGPSRPRYNQLSVLSYFKGQNRLRRLPFSQSDPHCLSKGLNQLLRNVASYNRRNVTLFYRSVDLRNSRNCMYLLQAVQVRNSYISIRLSLQM